MNDVFGMTIDGKHTSEFGLLMESMRIPQPEPRINEIEVLGLSGTVDMSEITGELYYENRKNIEFLFSVMDEGYEVWARIYSKISMWVHGKKVKVILDNDKGHYYVCRLEVDSKKSDEVLSKIVISGTAEPFKYDLCASDEAWLWDIFDFENGVIRELAEVQITTENQSVMIVGGGKPQPVNITVKSSDGLILQHNGRMYELNVGYYHLPMVRVGENDVELTFAGAGVISICYRGAYL